VKAAAASRVVESTGQSNELATDRLGDECSLEKIMIWSPGQLAAVLPYRSRAVTRTSKGVHTAWSLGSTSVLVVVVLVVYGVVPGHVVVDAARA
jgi:hypothetical protein